MAALKSMVSWRCDGHVQINVCLQLVHIHCWKMNLQSVKNHPRGHSHTCYTPDYQNTTSVRVLRVVSMTQSLKHVVKISRCMD